MSLNSAKVDKKSRFCQFCQRFQAKTLTGLTLFLIFVNFGKKTAIIGQIYI